MKSGKDIYRKSIKGQIKTDKGQRCRRSIKGKRYRRSITGQRKRERKK